MTRELSAWLVRWWMFIGDRFAPLSYFTMAAAFFTGNALIARRMTEALPTPGGAFSALFVTVLVFLRLRIFDEIKDADRDRDENPDRPLACGLIGLPEAKRMAVMVAAIELVLALLLGWPAFVAWCVLLIYSLLMYREFFVGSWMRPKMELYAVTHTFVASWLGIFVATAVTSRWPWDLPPATWILVGVNWAVFNLFEFARKSWGQDEERVGIPSYSGRLKPAGAAALAMSQAIPAAGGTALLATWTPPSPMLGASVALAAVGLTAAIAYAMEPIRGPAKRYRTTMTVFILGIYAVLAIFSAEVVR